MKIKPCTFETDSWNSSCMLNIPKNGWSLVKSGKTQDRFKNTGPIVDHTFRRDFVGSFLMISNTREATFSTPYLNDQNSVSYCAIRFWYYMYGDVKLMAYVKLHLYIEIIGHPKKIIRTISSNSSFPQQWIRHIEMGYLTGPYRFVFEGVFPGQGADQSIAIDDISYSEGCSLWNRKPITTTTKRTTTKKHTTKTRVTQATHFTDLTHFTGQTNTPTKSITTEKPFGDGLNGEKPSNSGAIVAGVLVPIFVIAGIIAVWYYRVAIITYYQRMRRRDEETMQLTMRNPAYDEPEMELEVKNIDLNKTQNGHQD